MEDPGSEAEAAGVEGCVEDAGLDLGGVRYWEEEEEQGGGEVPASGPEPVIVRRTFWGGFEGVRRCGGAEVRPQ